ncbi:MAG: hypothetical protein AAGJ18_17590 [Bacteroidota bacterium]
MKNTFYNIVFLLLISCGSEPNTQQSKALPNTPETVSKQWQYLLDNNEIEKVAQLSTDNTKAWLRENTALFLSDDQIYKTEFIQMDCHEEGDQAACIFIIKEEGELIEDIFLLKRVDGQWLVDIEEDTSGPTLDEQIFKEMEKKLKLD